MPIPKALITKRKEEDSPTKGLGEAFNCGNDAQPPVIVARTEQKCTMANKQSNQAFNNLVKTKSACVKRSSDIQCTVPATDDMSIPPEGGRAAVRPQSPSTTTSLTEQELEQDAQKLEASIRKACELELKLLNQCTRVREKRARMVRRLRKMKRSLQKLRNEDQWSIAHQFLFPPEYETPLKTRSVLIDMTHSSDTAINADLYDKDL